MQKPVLRYTVEYILYATMHYNPPPFTPKVLPMGIKSHVVFDHHKL